MRLPHISPPYQMLVFANIVIGLGIVPMRTLCLKQIVLEGIYIFHAGYDLLTIIPLLVLAISQKYRRSSQRLV